MPSNDFKECNICYENIFIADNNIVNCGNSKCTFYMCKSCIKSIYTNRISKCPQCRQPIDISFNNYFDILPNITVNNNIIYEEHYWNGYNINYRADCCNICFYISSCLCIIFVPKIVGYYICNGCHFNKVGLWKAWRTWNHVPFAMCEPVIGCMLSTIPVVIANSCYHEIKDRISIAPISSIMIRS